MYLQLVMTSDHQKAAQMIEKMRRWRVPNHKLWRDVDHFDVPGFVMRELADAGYCERRKLSGHSPNEYRPG